MTDVTFAATNGFSGSYKRSSFSIVASVLARPAMSRTMNTRPKSSTPIWRIRRRSAAPPENAPSAAEPAQAKPPRCDLSRVSASTLGICGAVNGSAITGTSFLRGDMGNALFGATSRSDDPHLPRGFRSRPFDSEGVATTKRAIIENGALTTWFLDCATARQLSLETTGHAMRGGGGMRPAPSNLYLAAGSRSAEELIRETGSPS